MYERVKTAGKRRFRAPSIPRCMLFFGGMGCADPCPSTLPRRGKPDYALLDDVLLQNVRNGYVDYDGITANPKIRASSCGSWPRRPTGSRQPRRGTRLLHQCLQRLRHPRHPGRLLTGHAHRPVPLLQARSNSRLAGADVTLEELEQERIRPMGDPRIHFAIVCASISCPRLSEPGLPAGHLDAQLEDAAQRFINDVTRNRFDITQRDGLRLRRFSTGSARTSTRRPDHCPGYLARYVQEPATRAALTEGRLAITPPAL